MKFKSKIKEIYTSYWLVQSVTNNQNDNRKQINMAHVYDFFCRILDQRIANTLAFEWNNKAQIRHRQRVNVVVILQYMQQYCHKYQSHEVIQDIFNVIVKHVHIEATHRLSYYYRKKMQTEIALAILQNA